ncbi:hypothetical protein J3A83DRAFT_4381712 [Scleroderma citrinum]
MSTARLKRKLGNLGVDVSSRKANEKFCLIGTPLPPLEKSKDTGEFVPLWKQEVRDEKGRRRLHGAFTGGFSAGYFNTVGSKEGWAPSTFVSSRAERVKARMSRPEDFMDEEDLAERRADQNLVSEYDEMDIVGSTQAEREQKAGLGDTEKDPVTLALEEAIVPTPRDSVGARILKKMSWKLGWGIGPRVSWRQHEVQCGRDPDKMDVDDEARKHSYPPRDTPLVVVARKDDFHGLGYNKALGLNATLGSTQEGSSAKRGPRLAGGFGLGVMNDADEDDLDVYDHAAGHGKSRTAFDVNDVQDEGRFVIGTRGFAISSRTVATKMPQSQDVRSSGRDTFRDGTPVLQGFVLSDKPVAEDAFPLPDVPEGWTPNPKQVWETAAADDTDKENAASGATSQPQTYTQWKIGITPDQRGAALGETPLSSASRSVFDYMSKKDQERIKNIAASHSTTSTTAYDSTTRASIPPPRSSGTSIPFIEPHIAEAALRGFQPFTSNPTKQARYAAYLRAHAEPASGISIPSRLQDQNPESYAQEMSEYAKAAALFRPVSGAMAGRFTSAAVLDLGPKVVEGLHKPATEPEPQEDSPEELRTGDEVKEEDPKVHAARLGMYGAMTREVKPWQPARLLCKRFGVKDPNPDMQYDTPIASSTQATDIPVQSDAATPTVPTSTSDETHDPAGKRDLANIGLGEDDGQGDDILTYERPAMDIFKAIFASDEENSDGEGDTNADGTPDDAAITPPIPPQTFDVSASTQPNLSEKPKSDIPVDIDMSTFKPTFIPRDPQAKAKEKESAKDKKGKKPRGAKSSVLVSFELDEADESLPLSGPSHKYKHRDRDRPKKKRKKQEEVNEDDMWVEKLPLSIVKDLPTDPHTESEVVETDGAQGDVRPRGRKRAVDFM